jgi:hypothetical protein
MKRTSLDILPKQPLIGWSVLMIPEADQMHGSLHFPCVCAKPPHFANQGQFP